ncbi:unnamed protein product [Prorocentrum cordatum]|uniref:Spen paralogue and orthologue SPOC C-terminal domain-containing protein n=1 Tax=Prorocentrum cordatum TaxID=2364126 RepID=A0ABN9VD13_9DINO|nr:unnamed protein product [Polarella glacialis]
MPSAQVALTLHDLGPPLLAKAAGPAAGEASPLEALCRLTLPEFVLLDPTAPNVPEWGVVERSCRPLAVLIMNANLPCHAGWIRDRLLLRGDWAEPDDSDECCDVTRARSRAAQRVQRGALGAARCGAGEAVRLEYEEVANDEGFSGDETEFRLSKARADALMDCLKRAERCAKVAKETCLKDELVELLASLGGDGWNDSSVLRRLQQQAELQALSEAEAICLTAFRDGQGGEAAPEGEPPARSGGITLARNAGKRLPTRATLLHGRVQDVEVALRSAAQNGNLLDITHRVPFEEVARRAPGTILCLAAQTHMEQAQLEEYIKYFRSKMRAGVARLDGSLALYILPPVEVRRGGGDSRPLASWQHRADAALRLALERGLPVVTPPSVAISAQTSSALSDARAAPVVAVPRSRLAEGRPAPPIRNGMRCWAPLAALALRGFARPPGGACRVRLPLPGAAARGSAAGEERAHRSAAAWRSGVTCWSSACTGPRTLAVT